MPDPFIERDRLQPALDVAAEEARRYLEALPDSPVLLPGTHDRIDAWSDPMPEEGAGTLAAIAELAARGEDNATRSGGPRFFHFVTGGETPAALAADWLTSAYDQMAFAWAASPLVAAMERSAVSWLRELFELPAGFGGVLTSGATMANFVGLAAARNWWGEQLGADVEEDGVRGLPEPLILSSGYVHPSATQVIGMLGFGRGSIRRLVGGDDGAIDLGALERELQGASTPAIVIANAGEVNAGAFDPIADMARLAKDHGAWLHVDGAFGLFARIAPETRALTEGVELADSVISDGHKWLNVPYDCGIAFVREPERVPRALNVGAPYLPQAEEARPSFGFMAPENSRRARAFTVWATLRAYGRHGYRAMVERHVALAQHLAELVDGAPELERLADVPLNIVCFRARPEGVPEEELDELNARLGRAVLEDGRVSVGTTTYRGKTALRPAIVNWRTQEQDIDQLVDVVRELAASLQRGTVAS